MLPFVSEQESILQEVLSAYSFPDTLQSAVRYGQLVLAGLSRHIGNVCVGAGLAFHDHVAIQP